MTRVAAFTGDSGLDQSSAEEEGDPPYQDSIWRLRYPDAGHSLEDALLEAVEIALRTLAENDSEIFDSLVRLLREKSHLETAQYLLVRSYAANGERYADEAAEYLLESPARLETGYASNPYWVTRQLLEAISLYCSDENMTRLEKLILGHYSDGELEAANADWCGSAQLTLLGGITPSRISTVAEERLEHLREKFGGDAEEPGPRLLRAIAGWVGSPIPEEETESMTDEEWLEALSRYAEDRHGR